MVKTTTVDRGVNYLAAWKVLPNSQRPLEKSKLKILRTWRCLVTVLSAVTILLSSCTAQAIPDSQSTAGKTTISQWKDGKKAVYLLSFDDNAPTQLDYVIPELNRREIVGTFYIVPGTDRWAATESYWAEAATSPYVVLANHTFTHAGVTSVDELETELTKSNDVLYRIYVDRPQPYLLSFGQPGGVPWNVTADEYAAALKSHNLVDRPPFKGSPVNYTTQDELIASVDQAIKDGGLGYNDMHGVGGDWLATPTEWFTALLDKLEAEKDQLWVPDVVTYDKYLTERQTAAVKVVNADANGIRVNLTSTADPVLYSYPLTLMTKVPIGWTRVSIEQGDKEAEAYVANGEVMYEAVPGAGEVHLTPK